jgi:hypothetical protein
MRYVIMDAMLDWLSVFFFVMLCTWIAVKISRRLGAWWREGKAEVVVEEVEHTDPIVIQASKVNPWRRQ